MKIVEIIAVVFGLLLGITALSAGQGLVGCLVLVMAVFLLFFGQERKGPVCLRPWVKKCFRKKPVETVEREPENHTAQQPAPAPKIPQPAHQMDTGNVQEKEVGKSMLPTVIMSEEAERGQAGIIRCEWPDREETDLKEINRVLAKMELSSLKILEYKTYLQTETTQNTKTGETTASYRMGLDSLKLYVVPANHAERYRYQIGVYTVADAVVFDRDWKQMHPGQVIRYKIGREYKCGQYGVLVAYHDRVVSKPERLATAGADSSGDGIVYTRHTDGTMCIFDGSGAGGEVDIPETIDGYPVTRIRSKAFAGNDKLTRICIGRSIRCIEAEAFQDCYNLFEVEIPAGVTEIGTGAFKNCGRKEDEELSRGMTARSRRDLEYMFGWGYEAVESKLIGYQLGMYDGYLYEMKATVARGSYAEQYCKNNNIQYVVK